MKKITSAVLALTMLLTLCACNGDVAGSETSVQSETESTPIISIDPSSTLFSSETSSDTPSNEGSKPDENVSSEEPTPPPTPEEEEEQARIQTALNNPGASLDYDVFLVDAPEEGNEWKLLRYNMEEEKLYEEFSFSPKNATGSYTVDFIDEYVGNILKVTFEDGMNCYIDVEKNKFYNSSEFKGLSKTLSVTKRNIGVTKNGQYEVWTTSHPDYGKVYYSELNEDENLLLTVFLKNNKYTFTSYNYETKELKNLFTISEKPEVKLLNDGWFIFELFPHTAENYGRLYICNIAEGVRRKITVEGKRILIGAAAHINSSYVSATPEIMEGIFDELKKGNVSWDGRYLRWFKPYQLADNILYEYRYDLVYGDISRITVNGVRIKDETVFFDVGGLVAHKRYTTGSSIDPNSETEEAPGNIYIDSGGSVQDATGYYFTADGRLCLCNKTNPATGKREWQVVTVHRSDSDEIKTVIRNKNALNNPGVTIGDDVWIFDGVDLNDRDRNYTRLYRYNLISQTIHLYKIFVADRLTSYVLDEDGFGLEYHADVDYIKILTYTVEGTDYGVFDYKNSVLLDYMEGYEIFEEKHPYRIIPTEFDTPAIGDGYIEVPATYNGFGTVQETVYLENRNQIVISYGEYRYDSKETYVVLYDYNTNKFKEILAESEDALMRLVDDRFILINISDLPESCEYPDDCRLYVYDLNTGKIVKAPIDDPYSIYEFVSGERYHCKYEGVYHNGVFWWYYDDSLKNADATRTYTVTLFTYDPIKNERRDFLVLEAVNNDAFENWYFVENGVFIKGTADYFNSLVGPLYYCTVNKTTCISEKALRYFVCEDQGYVMYYEEQEDGSFEWKYYNF